MFLLFGFKIQHCLRRRSSVIFCFFLRSRFIFSHMFFFISFWPWMCLFLVSLQIFSQKYKVKTPSPLTWSYGHGNPFPANFYEQLLLKAQMTAFLAKCCFSFPFFCYIFVLHKIIMLSVLLSLTFHHSLFNF